MLRPIYGGEDYVVDIFHYQCQNCGSHFRREEETHFDECPSCGRDCVVFWKKVTYTREMFKSVFDKETYECIFGGL